MGSVIEGHPFIESMYQEALQCLERKDINRAAVLARTIADRICKFYYIKNFSDANHLWVNDFHNQFPSTTCMNERIWEKRYISKRAHSLLRSMIREGNKAAHPGENGDPDEKKVRKAFKKLPRLLEEFSREFPKEADYSTTIVAVRIDTTGEGGDAGDRDHPAATGSGQGDSNSDSEEQDSKGSARSGRKPPREGELVTGKGGRRTNGGKGRSISESPVSGRVVDSGKTGSGKPATTGGADGRTSPSETMQEAGRRSRRPGDGMRRMLAEQRRSGSNGAVDEEGAGGPRAPRGKGKHPGTVEGSREASAPSESEVEEPSAMDPVNSEPPGPTSDGARPEMSPYPAGSYILVSYMAEDEREGRAVVEGLLEAGHRVKVAGWDAKAEDAPGLSDGCGLAIALLSRHYSSPMWFSLAVRCQTGVRQIPLVPVCLGDFRELPYGVRAGLSGSDWVRESELDDIGRLHEGLRPFVAIGKAMAEALRKVSPAVEEEGRPDDLDPSAIVSKLGDEPPRPESRAPRRSTGDADPTADLSDSGMSEEPRRDKISRVFVSYSIEDGPNATEIIERLRREGFDVKSDNGVPCVSSRISECELFIPIVSSRYAASVECLDEMCFACESGMRVLPVYIGDVGALPKGVVLQLSKYQGLGRYDFYYSGRFYERLLELVPSSDASDDGPELPFQVGDVVKGTVVSVGGDEVLLDIDFTFDGVIPASELSARGDVDPRDVVVFGETVEAMVIGVRDSWERVVLSRRRLETARERIWRTFDDNTVIEGKVVGIADGGLMVDVGLRGLLPTPLMDPGWVENPGDLIGERIKVRVMEVDRDRDGILLSRSMAFDDARRAERAEILGKLAPGMMLVGRISAITDLGVFVDLGGIDGLIHLHDLSHDHFDHPSEVVGIGQVTRVLILDVDVERELLILGRKQTTG